MAHTYIDITAGTNKLRDAIAATGSGSSLTALKVFRMAAGTYTEDLGTTYLTRDYIRVEPAAGAEGLVIVQHTHASGFRMGQPGSTSQPNYCFFEEGIEWRTKATAGSKCWTLDSSTSRSGGPIEIRGHSKLMGSGQYCIQKNGAGYFTGYFYGTAEGDSATGTSRFFSSTLNTNSGTFYVAASAERPGSLDPDIENFSIIFQQGSGGDLEIGATRVKGFERLFDLDNAGYSLSYDIDAENILAWDQRGATHAFVYFGNHSTYDWVPNIRIYNSLFADGQGKAVYMNHRSVSNTVEFNNVVLYDITNGVDINLVSGTDPYFKNAIRWLCSKVGGVWWSEVTTEPAFVAPLDSPPDYHVPWGWNGQDNGFATGVTVDMDGVARPQGASIDRGPYEAVFTSSGPSLGRLIRSIRDARSMRPPGGRA